jgi:hypothetical protein
MVYDPSRLSLLDWALKGFMGHFTNCSRYLTSTRLPLKSLLAEGKLFWTHRDIAN